MERLYRTMRADADGLPRVGRGARLLGVRVDGPRPDVTPDADDRFHAERGGLSVTVDDPALMPPARRPRWLSQGASEDPLFGLIPASVGDPLSVRVDVGAHALVEPRGVMELAAYEAALTATRAQWREEHRP